MDADPAPLRDRLRTALRTAMKARDAAAVAALRSALGAIDNAEAVDAAHVASTAEGPGGLAGTVGLGAGEATRRTLTEADVERIVRAEAADRRAAAREYEGLGQADRASRLDAEAGILEAQLS